MVRGAVLLVGSVAVCHGPWKRGTGTKFQEGDEGHDEDGDEDDALGHWVWPSETWSARARAVRQRKWSVQTVPRCVQGQV